MSTEQECFCCGEQKFSVRRLERENMLLCDECRYDPALDIAECQHKGPSPKRREGTLKWTG